MRVKEVTVLTESFRIGGVGSGYVGLVMGSSEVRPVNIGNPREHPVREIAELVIEPSGGKSELAYEPLPEDDPGKRCPDVARARDAMGWASRVGVREGLEKTFDWLAKRMDAPETPVAPKP